MSAWSAGVVNAASTVDQVGALGFTWFAGRGKAVQTVQRYQASLHGSIHRELGNLTLGELTNGQVRSFVRAIADAGHTSEARNTRVVIRHVLAFAVEQGYDKPELMNFDGFQLPVPVKTPRAITDNELERLRGLVDAYRDRVRSGPKGSKRCDDLLDMLDIALATSLRISEVLAIRGDLLELDREKPFVRVVGKIEYAAGVGYREGAPKTSATVRDIELPPFAVEILRRRRQADGGLVFRSAKAAGGPISQNNLRLVLRTIIKGTEFEGWFTPHTARKTTLTAVSAELGAEIASRVAGHSDGGTLIRSTYDEGRPIAPNVTEITERLFRRKA